MFNDDFRFARDVGAHIGKILNDFRDNASEHVCEVVYSDDIMTKKVIRIRLYAFENYPENESIQLLRELAERCLNITLRGFNQITKIYTTKSQKEDCNITTFNKVNGKMELSQGNFIIETDGCSLQ